ncbi:metal ABC transporter substrate-binding protein [Uliginosibacterium sediminicola]|uniref:Zinc ABC transporter substrate-binding protein n=1 Tax=Uliginosibacterium sediminicola TaxID=2024550 RepID=A0ABU9YT44_9RHOO
MNRIFQSVFAMLIALAAQSSQAALRVVACEPEWGALVQELAGDKASVYTATNALQDPHHVQARPSLIASVRNADLVACTGAELEIGWLPILLRQSGNPAIQPGKPGYFEAAEFVRKLEVPGKLDRADGDVHPGGNPHIQTDPRNISLVAAALSARLASIDPANAGTYRARYDDFKARWQAAILRWEKQAAPLRGVSIVAHHKAYAYLENWLGLVEVGTLEPKPGVEPSSAHLSELLASLQRQPAKMIVRSAYEEERASQWLSERAKIPAVVIPFTVGGSAQAKDLFSTFDDTVVQLLRGLK